MIRSEYISTQRLRLHILHRPGKPGGESVLLLHGNASSSVFWKETMQLLPESFDVIAPDLRGYGKTEDKLIDATKGFGDQTEDIIELLDELNIKSIHVAGHSMGGGIVYMLMAQFSERLLSATLINPLSPFGFGGTKGAEGIPVWDDFAGTGAGVANPEFARRIKEKDRSIEDPNASPRAIMNAYYWKPPFRAHNEDELLEGVLQEKIGDKKYPGDSVTSEHWPHTAPGVYGPVNAASPKYVQGLARQLIQSSPKVPVLWVRGSDDKIVSNESLFDPATLGMMGLIPGYPGKEVYPPQPMIDQTRAVLDVYAKHDGSLREVVIPETGHSPFIEKPEVFMNHFNRILTHG